MILSKIFRLLISDLFRTTEGLFIFTLYRRYNLPPKKLFEIIKKLEEIKIVKVDNDRIFLTKEGIEFAISNKIKGKIDLDRKKLIPENFLGVKIEINNFYIPLSFEQI